MLKELSKYENLGTPRYHFELLKTLRDKPGAYCREKYILEHFYNRMIDGKSVFDGCLPLLSSIGIIVINAKNEIIADGIFLNTLSSETQMIGMLLERLMLSLRSDSVFHDIFCSEHISYDILYRSIQINNSAFPLQYAGFKQLLIDFSFLKEHPTRKLNKFIVNSKYKKIFDKVLLPEIKKRKVGIEELQRSLEKNQIYGEEAEKFVLEFENQRLHERKEIAWVSEYSVSAGYDIASYETVSSLEFDRFIEVKSFIEKPNFFWSRNEMDVARIKKKSYYLYLVDRSSINSSGYVPIIIRDPYTNVFENTTQWDQTIEKTRFRLTNDRW